MNFSLFAAKLLYYCTHCQPSSKLYFETTLLLPTSQSLIAYVFEFIIRMFSGLISQ